MDEHDESLDWGVRVLHIEHYVNSDNALSPKHFLLDYVCVPTYSEQHTAYSCTGRADTFVWSMY